jgi:hypothetical protein
LAALYDDLEAVLRAIPQLAAAAAGDPTAIEQLTSNEDQGHAGLRVVATAFPIWTFEPASMVSPCAGTSRRTALSSGVIHHHQFTPARLDQLHDPAHNARHAMPT